MKLLRILALFAIFCFLPFAGFAQQQNKFYFNNFSGRAQLSRTSGSTWLTLAQGEIVEVKPGDIIALEGGRGELRFPNGSTVKIKNGAIVTLDRYGIGMRVGYAWADIRKSGEIFKISFPFGSCHVLGTSFDVDIDKYGKTKVRTMSGIVAVRAADSKISKQLVLQAGMSTYLAGKSSLPEKPDRFQHVTELAKLDSEWDTRHISYTQPVISGRYLPGDEQSSEGGFLPLIKSDSGSSAMDATKARMEMQRERVGTGMDSLRQKLARQREMSGQRMEAEKTRAAETMAREKDSYDRMIQAGKPDKDPVIAASKSQEDVLKRVASSKHFGESKFTEKSVKNLADKEREYETGRAQLRRLENRIRGLESEIRAMIAQNNSAPAFQRKIIEAQKEVKDLQMQRRILDQRLRSMQRKKLLH